MKLNTDNTAILLLDDVGLMRPTEAELDVLASVLVALSFFKLRWHERARAGEPSVTDYAAHVVRQLRDQYLEDLP
jgi:hypothetical protein